MELGWFFSMLMFLWIAAVTPGPNNMLLTSSTANFGFVRSLPLMFGIMMGMQLLLLLVAAGVGTLITAYPPLHLILKILGSLYLIWLAWKIATSRYEKLETDKGSVKPVRLYQGLLLQALNPKAWLMGLGSIASYSLAGSMYSASVIAISVAMFMVNLVAGLVWMGFGSAISRLLRSRQSWAIFNVSMGILTAGCVVFIWQ
ncbi:Cysteine/O-acetylserine efflux protein [Pragia fontium]|uniref:Alcohol dehydrogenase n=1 Tax=Pragia fontium TaxID=82985 RepID=A0ABQ5LMJ0_9GAMM|nr:LysE family translocator [Pragia fontium]AKJ40923.1 alcohol dehydrogenase [Pragia fontium]GKX64604.1 alcohol dehydrogenase [Pragia fontium]SUB81115.1 Cysteine/O-acetylserine efflux protein [Pragia fontium]